MTKTPRTPYKKNTRYWKFPGELLLPEVRQRPAKQCINFFNNFFFQSYWSCPRAYRDAIRRRWTPLDGITDFLSKIWQHITTVIFVSAFIFFVARKPNKASRKRLFLQLSETQFTGMRQRRPPAEIVARWRCVTLIKKMSSHCNSLCQLSYCFHWEA